ncbi:MAG: glycosyltransferase, partial [Gammaproteobacteria bacterium]
MNQKRITLIYQQLDLGGRQLALLALAEALQGRGWQVEILSFLHGELEEKFARRGISVQVFPVRPKVRRILKLRRHFLRNPPMIVHTHLFSAGFWGRISAKLAGVPVIIHTEGGMPFEEKRWKRVPAEHLLTRLSDAVICVAQAIKDHLVDAGGLAAESLLVIPNGVAADNLLRLPIRTISDRPVVFSAGRLAKVKGYDLLIRAMANLDGVTGKLLLAGDGPEAGPLKRLSATLGVSDQVEFLGYREDVQQLLAQADLYVTASRSEGMSNSILEAMAAGV